MAAPPLPVRRIISFEADPHYWQSLGRFIETFAGTETVAFTFLATYARLDAWMARAILSGVRADQLINAIRRSLAVAPPGEQRYRAIDEVLLQFKAINDVRNSVVHSPSFLTDDKGRIVSTAAKAHIPERVTETRVSPTLLDAMSHDLTKISDQFIAMLPWRHGGIPGERPAAQFPWQYIRPQVEKQKSQTLKRRGRTRSQSLAIPPRSSRQ